MIFQLHWVIRRLKRLSFFSRDSFKKSELDYNYIHIRLGMKKEIKLDAIYLFSLHNLDDFFLSLAG